MEGACGLVCRSRCRNRRRNCVCWIGSAPSAELWALCGGGAAAGRHGERVWSGSGKGQRAQPARRW